MEEEKNLSDSDLLGKMSFTEGKSLWVSRVYINMRRGIPRAVDGSI